MVFLLTDTGEYRQLPCPGEVTIGRGPDNTIRCNIKDKSVSQNHAKISIQAIEGIPGRFEIFLEDLNSTNGTYIGETKLDEEKLQKGKRKLHFGDYIRFGQNDCCFRLFERVPSPDDDKEEERKRMEADEYEEELRVSPSNTKKIEKSKTGKMNINTILYENNAKNEESGYGSSMLGSSGGGGGGGGSGGFGLPSINFHEILERSQIPKVTTNTGNMMEKSSLKSSGGFEGVIGAFPNIVNNKSVKFDDSLQNVSVTNNHQQNKEITFPSIQQPSSSSAATASSATASSLKRKEVSSYISSASSSSSSSSTAISSLDQLLSFQKYFFPNYSKENLSKYLKINELWLKQLKDQLKQTQKNQIFYLKFIENMMQIHSLSDLLSFLSEDDGGSDSSGKKGSSNSNRKSSKSEEEKKGGKKGKKNSGKGVEKSLEEIHTLYDFEGNVEEMSLISELFHQISKERQDYICSEFMAEHLLLSSDAGGGVGGNENNLIMINLFGETILQLQELRKLCYVGVSHHEENKGMKGEEGGEGGEGQHNYEIDYLLNQELIQIMKIIIKNIQIVSSSPLMDALTHCYLEEEMEEIDQEEASRRKREENVDEDDDDDDDGDAGGQPSRHHQNYPIFHEPSITTGSLGKKILPSSLPYHYYTSSYVLPSLTAHFSFFCQKLNILIQFCSFYFLNSSNALTFLSNQSMFEMLVLYINILLILLYKIYVMLLMIFMEISNLYEKHITNTNSNQIGNTSQQSNLFNELQRLTLLNYQKNGIVGGGDGGGGGNEGKELKTIIDKLRKYENDLAGKKYSG
jgi:pSer/pThr/pTyr-binding forkhead associated (FHA) protein